ncbi:hypothetical protein [Acerihabitans arboris]|uniref:Uncharacterized protein n=1 Tax=Acerihabitans arboris TaxID=2691583 RepID=A0A845SI82_9GAMM|nr:hypothetical protein [Acerihabitans arboris]NDL62368.1 hypothetical protein [Acerihabitans arboris]
MLNVFNRNLPTHQGEYSRVARYPQGAYIPWIDIIGPGDIVTNFPVFMSVSSEERYAISLAKQTGADMAAGKDHLANDYNRKTMRRQTASLSLIRGGQKPPATG